MALMLNAEADERKQQEQTLLTLTTKLNSFLREAEVLAEARELALSKTHREIEFVENAFMRTLLRLNISPTSDIGTKLTRAFSLEMERKKP